MNDIHQLNRDNLEADTSVLVHPKYLTALSATEDQN